MSEDHRPVVRPIHAHEWRRVRDLRLLALTDEVAHLAFLDTHEDAARRPDEFWQERAAGSSVEAGEDSRFHQLVAVARLGSGDGPDDLPDGGAWLGSVTLLAETAGDTDFFGAPVTVTGVQLVGVYVRPDARGRGLIDRLVEAAVARARERGHDQVRLFVNEHNVRAAAAYRRCGFVETGHRVAGSTGDEVEMVRALG
ncbi:N-acetyltransferase [Paraoerskovia sediminicola]|uniref:N-acetyltransferase n=1 Tax=Paraoerskovia sediminicola TaxID=1138587 RepID=A0ABN6XAL6_9CELL|nr:GNAT family N-acetyltransferase [Paraoerskovia sediminicola]BDZ41906.1 N-acetyltransferase [Paraoerskovia sediminicola]